MDDRGNIYEQIDEDKFKDLVTKKEFTSKDFTKALKMIPREEYEKVKAMNHEQRIDWYNKFQEPEFPKKDSFLIKREIARKALEGDE